MQIEVINHRRDLAAMCGEWEGLRRPSVMQSPTWLLRWWDIYDWPNRELAVVAVREKGALVGLAPWYADTSSGVRKLRWLGDGRACSDHHTILCHPARQSDVARAIADWICTASRDDWQQLVLEAIDDDDTVLARLVNEIADRGQLITRRAEPGTCYVELPATWDDYLAHVSKNHRKRCRRLDKQFFESGRARVEALTSASECLAAFERLVHLHNDRRVALDEEGPFSDPRFDAFHRAAIAELAASGGVQLRLLSIDGQLVAAEYVLIEGDTQFAYQSGLSAAGEAHSAGFVSMISLVRDAIERGFRRIDLLRGVESYKFSWGAVHRPATTMHIRRPTLSGRVGAWCDTAWVQARQLKRRLARSV